MLFARSLNVVQVLLVSHFTFATDEQHVFTTETRLRKATFDDADDIATIVMAAFEPMLDWQYFRQFRHEFPEGHRECVRYGVTQMLNNPNTNTEVIEAPYGSDVPLVAMATWSKNQIPSTLFAIERDAPSRYLDIVTRMELM